MTTISLRDERPALTVEYGGAEYKIPLTFNRMEYIALNKADDKAEWGEKFFRKYLTDEVYEAIDDLDMALILDTWKRERAALGTPTVGEL